MNFTCLLVCLLEKTVNNPIICYEVWKCAVNFQLSLIKLVWCLCNYLAKLSKCLATNFIEPKINWWFAVCRKFAPMLSVRAERESDKKTLEQGIYLWRFIFGYLITCQLSSKLNWFVLLFTETFTETFIGISWEVKLNKIDPVFNLETCRC